MRRLNKRVRLIVGLIVLMLTPNVSYSQESKSFESFVELFPEQYLPFSIAENELIKFDRTAVNPIPKGFSHFLPQNFSSVDMAVYAYASVKLENDKILLFHLEESKYPFVRKVYMTVFSEEGFPESTELFASYEKDFAETFTYAIVNKRMIMHRTTKTFEPLKNEVSIKTDKFRLNNIGEIVAL